MNMYYSSNKILVDLDIKKQLNQTGLLGASLSSYVNKNIKN